MACKQNTTSQNNEEDGRRRSGSLRGASNSCQADVKNELGKLEPISVISSQKITDPKRPPLLLTISPFSSVPCPMVSDMITDEPEPPQ
jgi:hypothetical protein